MKKVSIILTGLFLAASVVSFGQTKPAADPATKAKRQEIKKDIKGDKAEVKADKAARAADMKAGDKAAAAKETKEIKKEKADMRKDKKELKSMHNAKK